MGHLKDFGSSHFRVGVMRNGTVEILPDNLGENKLSDNAVTVLIPSLSSKTIQPTLRHVHRIRSNLW
jgi:hypothetical protein